MESPAPSSVAKEILMKSDWKMNEKISYSPIVWTNKHTCFTKASEKSSYLKGRVVHFTLDAIVPKEKEGKRLWLVPVDVNKYHPNR